MMTELLKLDQDLLNPKTEIKLDNLATFQQKFAQIANVNYTAEMVALEHQALAKDEESLKNFKELEKIFYKRLKIVQEKWKIINRCFNAGFKSETEKLFILQDFVKSFNEFRAIYTKIGFGIEQDTKATNSYISAYHRK